MLQWFEKKKVIFSLKKLEKTNIKSCSENLKSTFFLTSWAAQTAQAEEFVFQNVTYRTTVYRAGTYMNKKKIHVAT